MTHPVQASDELTDEAVMELVDRLFDRWQLDEKTRRQLLSNDPELRRAERPESSTATERARQLLTIDAGLRLLFPEDQDLRWTWVTRRNHASSGATPLEVMLIGDAGSQMPRHVGLSRLTARSRARLCLTGLRVVPDWAS